MTNVFRSRNFYAVLFSAVLSIVFVAALASASTTISTNISTSGTLTVSGASTFTGAATFNGQAILQNATSDPTGAGAGALYFNTANSLVRIYDGTAWGTVATSTSANGGLVLAGDGNRRIQLNDLATGYVAFGTSTDGYVGGIRTLTLSATTSAGVPLTIYAAKGSQTANLLDIFDTTQTSVFSVTNAGNTTVVGTLGVTGATTLTGALSANGNVTLGNALADVITITGAATSSNSLNVGGVFSVNGRATTTASGNMTLVGTLGIATTSPTQELGVAGDIHAGSSATTTLSLHSNGTGIGSCIQLRATDGTVIRIYATSTPSTTNYKGLVVEAGSCQ